MEPTIPLSYSIGFGGTMLLLAIVGALANLIVVFAILGDGKMRKSPMNLLLSNLAVADFVFIAIYSTKWTPLLISRGYGWMLPNELCPWWSYGQSSTILISIITYTTIAIERYIAIVHPIKSTYSLNSRKKIGIIILLIWLCVLGYESPIAIYVRSYPVQRMNETHWVCYNKHSKLPLFVYYKWSEVVLTYFLPILLSAVLYNKICQVLWNSGTNLLRGKGQKTPSKADGCRSPAAEAILRQRKNVVKMMISSVSMFFVCYTPMIVKYILQNIFYFELPKEFTLFSIVPILAASAANPFIYALFSEKFRGRLMHMFPCCGWATKTALMKRSTRTSRVMPSTIRRKQELV